MSEGLPQQMVRVTTYFWSERRKAGTRNNACWSSGAERFVLHTVDSLGAVLGSGPA